MIPQAVLAHYFLSNLSLHILREERGEVVLRVEGVHPLSGEQIQRIDHWMAMQVLPGECRAWRLYKWSVG
jgi:hypothetical protein